MLTALFRMLFVSIFITAASEAAAQPDTPSTQAIAEIRGDLKTSEGQLDSVIAVIQKRYSGDLQFLKIFSDAQRAWCRYRDLQVAMKFSENDKATAYGSLYPMCLSLELIRLYTLRIEELTPWASGVIEGEVCPGSVLIDKW